MLAARASTLDPWFTALVHSVGRVTSQRTQESFLVRDPGDGGHHDGTLQREPQQPAPAAGLILGCGVPARGGQPAGPGHQEQP